MTLTPTDITPGVIVTNGKGRFRLVFKVVKLVTWWDVYYHHCVTTPEGAMVRRGDGLSGMRATLRWSTRLATPEERAEVVRCLNPKGSNMNEVSDGK